MPRLLPTLALTAALLNACNHNTSAPPRPRPSAQLEQTHGELSSTPGDTASHEGEFSSPPGVERRADSDFRPRSSVGDSAPAGQSHAEPAAPAKRGADARASGRASASQAAPEVRPTERPGLGTEWGETRTSRVSSVAFEREQSSTPFSVTTLYYNDAQGLRAMTRGAELSSFASSEASVGNGALSVRLMSASGSALPMFELGSRALVQGSHGSRYVIQVRNHTGQRFEAVATVDGLDVMDGRPGSYHKRGYLIAPWATLEIDGFRQSEQQVAAFRFGSVADSYAASKGAARNVGVIGVAFFEERGAVTPLLEREVDLRDGAEAFPGRFATPPR